MDIRALLFDTDPLATIALLGVVSLIIVTFGIAGFVWFKLPKKGQKSS